MRSSSIRTAVSSYRFAAGYVAAWIPFSLVATALQRALARAELLSPMTLSSTLPVAGILLVATGIWQLSPLDAPRASRRSPNPSLQDADFDKSYQRHFLRSRDGNADSQ